MSLRRWGIGEYLNRQLTVEDSRLIRFYALSDLTSDHGAERSACSLQVLLSSQAISCMLGCFARYHRPWRETFQTMATHIPPSR